MRSFVCVSSSPAMGGWRRPIRSGSLAAPGDGRRKKETHPILTGSGKEGDDSLDKREEREGGTAGIGGGRLGAAEQGLGEEVWLPTSRRVRARKRESTRERAECRSGAGGVVEPGVVA
ncbi:hypothetical protein COCNU_11G003710 [Cocos nucifera]|uniref:Uncharacterized protein n=1 Tax=Cocos nucifera TaxID=13894 RepID=A0A8K0N914_COCNU|nr:hypothetical protein COCNU_11G003710 [Cocos nucifera]